MRTFLLVLALAVASLAQNVHTDRDGAKVLPLPEERGVWHFSIYGDRTGGPREGVKVLAEAVGETNLLDPDLVMTVGDLIQGYNTTEPWLEEMREFTGIMNGLNMPWYPVAGNHDVYWRGPDRPRTAHEANYEEHFGPLWYWFRHKNAAFVVLYTDEGDLETGQKGFRGEKVVQMSKKQLAWLRDTLWKTKDARHVFVFMHHPRWLTDYYEGTNFAAMHAELKRPGNVRAVFAGHIHQMRYDGKKDGIEYFALATTGGGLGMVAPEAGALHHQNVVTVRDEGISVATIPVGTVIDPREITGELVDEVRKLGRLPAPEVVKAVSHASPSAGDGERPVPWDGTYAVRIVNPTTLPIEVTAQVDTFGEPVRFSPGHEHFELAPGTSRVLESRWKVLGHEFRSPELVVGVDVLAKDRRIALPARRFRVRAPFMTFDSKDLGKDTGHALRLDGASACAEIVSDSFDVPQGAFTVECRMRADAFRSRSPLLAKTQNSEWSIFLNDGHPRFSVYLGGRYREAVAGDVSLDTERWYHVAGVFDGSEVRLYVDGKLVAKAAAKGQRRGNRLPFFVGADPDGSGSPTDHFDGLIDEVRVSTTARYAGDSFEPAMRHEPDEHTAILLHFDRRFGPVSPGHGADAHAELLGEAELVPLR